MGLNPTRSLGNLGAYIEMYRQEWVIMDNIIDRLAWDSNTGAVTFNGVRYLLIRPETLATWQEAVERHTDRAGELVFSGGLAGGRLSGRGFAQQMGLTPRQMVDFMLDMGSQIGWGRFVLEDLSQDRLVVKAFNSPFAIAHSPATEGVCHLIRGVFAGVAETILGSQVMAGEEECLAKGDRYCRFIFAKKF